MFGVHCCNERQMSLPEQAAPTSTLALGPSRGTDLLADAPTGRNVLAVLDGTTAGEWRRQWHREVGWEPAQMGVVETFELTRGAAASEPETRVVDEDLAMATVERPVEPGTLRDLVGQFLDGWHGGRAKTVVYFESLGVCAEDGDPGPLLEVLPEILDHVERVDARLYACLDDEAVPPSAVVRAREPFDAVRGRPLVDASVLAAIEGLRADDPTTFGYLRRHWREAMRGLRLTDRSYPQAKQVHAVLEEPETTPRTLGTALQGLVNLDALGLWGDTVGPNRYDTTAYDPERHAAIGLAMERHSAAEDDADGDADADADDGAEDAGTTDRDAVTDTAATGEAAADDD